MTDEPRRRTLNLEAISHQEELRLGEEDANFSEVQNYLQWFGYLGAEDYTPGALDDSTAEALRTYQQRNDLPESGAFDDSTREQMTVPRCAMPDLRNGVAFSTTCAWDRRSLSFAFDMATDDIAGAAEFDAVRSAFRTWGRSAPLTFTEVTAFDDPDVLVGWRPANDPDLSMVGGTLAHADFPPGCSVVTNSLPKPVHFDDSEHTWSIGAAASAFDVETVALHEIGHILGLAHSTVTGSVMFPTVSANSTLKSLTQDDLDGITGLYPDRQWVDIGHANNVVGMTALNGKLFCATSDNNLWMRDAVPFEVDWVDIGHANNVVGMAALKDKLFCATSDNNLWMRHAVPFEVDWVDIGHANNVVGMAAFNGKLFCATGDNNLWMRDAVPFEVDWVDIGHANSVVGMCAEVGSIYCATSDNNLWVRTADT